MLVRAGTNLRYPTPREGLHIINVNFTLVCFLVVFGEEEARLGHNGRLHCQDASFTSLAQPAGNVEIFAWVSDASHALSR